MKSSRVMLRRLVRNNDIVLVIVLMLAFLSMIDYEHDYEREHEEA